MPAPALFLVGSALLWLFARGRRRASPEPVLTDEDIVSADHDWNHLDPTFRASLESLFAELEAKGWQPGLFEGWRDPVRQLALYDAGRSKVKWGLHCYVDPVTFRPRALAADVIDKRTGWGDPRFFDALAAAAVARGMEAGHYWRWKDSAHVQAVPSTYLSAIQRGQDPSPWLDSLAVA